MTDAPSLKDFVTNFDAVRSQFQQQFDGLLLQRSYIEDKHPELLSEYNQKVLAAANHLDTLRKIVGLRNFVVNYLKSNYGLGALPALVGVGAALASLAVITKYLKDLYVFSKKTNRLRELEAQGYSPAQATQLANQAYDPASPLANTLKWAAIGGGVLLIAFYIRKKGTR